MSARRAAICPRLTAALAAVVVLLAGPGAPAALACSAGPDYNPVSESEVIVVGRLAGWREAGPDVPPRPDESLFVPIVVTLEVDRTLKGSTPASIELLEYASLYRMPAVANRPEQTYWAGAAGACGSFDDDPTGMYAVMGLSRNADGTYQPNRIHTFYVGGAPPAVVWDRIVARLTHSGPVSFPLTGMAARARFDHGPGAGRLATAVAGLALVLTAGVLALRRRA